MTIHRTAADRARFHALIPAEGPRKPAYGAACNGCGLCCVAVPCSLAMAFIDQCDEAKPCPALEWADGRSWCGLIRNPAKYVKPILWLAIGGKAAHFSASVAGDLIKGSCDSGPWEKGAPDEDLGKTAAEYHASALAADVTWTTL